MAAPTTSAASSAPLSLHSDLHTAFIHNLDAKKETFHYWTSRHLRVSGIYWALGAMSILDKLSAMPRDEIIAFTRSCYNPKDGGYGGNEGQDSHMLYTLSAIQVLCMLGAEEAIDKEAVGAWLASRQQEDGSFSADEWGEIDTRFTYCALNGLSLIGKLELVDLGKAADYIVSCQNWDGGFGVVPAAESHSGQVFCCLGALCIANALDRIDQDKLGFWLASRQLPSSGGLNGRPEKKADVCYSWWVMSSLSMLRRLHWISRKDLFRYILMCQDDEDGGIADKPDNMPDVYHTFFGLCGLTLLGYEGAPLNKINPVYAMPYETLDRLGVAESCGRDVGRVVDLSKWSE